MRQTRTITITLIILAFAVSIFISVSYFLAAFLIVAEQNGPDGHKIDFDVTFFPYTTSQLQDDVWDYDGIGESTLCYEYGIAGRCFNKMAILSRLNTAHYAFNLYSNMFVGEYYNVSLVIDPSSEENPAGHFDSEGGQIEEGVTKIALRMEAELSGTTFDIEPKGRVERELSFLNPTRWNWKVRPTAEGERALQLSLYVVLQDSLGKKIAEDNPLVERRTILVEVKWIDWASDLAKKLNPIHALLAALAASAAGVLTWLGFHRKRSGDE